MLALIPLVLQLAPSISNWLFGSSAEKTTAAVVSAAAAITGTSDPEAQVRALQDPAQATAFQIELAKITQAASAEQRANELATFQAQLADVASARNQTVALAQAKSPIAWGAPIVSVVVLATFGAMLGCVLAVPLPQGSESLANVMLGTLSAMSTAVVSFWVGSSSGSHEKDATISRTLAASQPPLGIAERRASDQGPPPGTRERRAS